MAGLMVSLVCAVVAGTPAEVPSQLSDQQTRERVVGLDSQQSQREGTNSFGLFTLVAPSEESLVIELGRSRLLRFRNAIRRIGLSDANVSDAVQIGPKDILVLGRRPGVTDFTVWPVNREAAVTVIEIRVERRLGSGW